MIRQISKRLMHGLAGDLGTHYQDIGMPRSLRAYDGIQLGPGWKLFGISQQPDWWRVVHNCGEPVDKQSSPYELRGGSALWHALWISV